jgi:peptidoglycan-associated lipoprotein
MTSVSRLTLATVFVAAIGVGAAGCAKKAPPPAPAPPPPAPTATAPPPPPPPPPPPTPAPTPALSEEEIFAKKTLEQLNAEKPLSDVFFDLDMATLRDEGRSVLQKDAEWLRKWDSTKVTVEGHADSRGTTEYNLALGERRAQAVKDYLTSLEIAGDRILTISKGKESPFCTEETEACWQQNRRGHFIITAK